VIRSSISRKVLSGLLLASLISFATPTNVSAATSATPKPTSTNPYGAGAIDPAGPNEPVLEITSSTKTQKFTMKALRALKPIRITIFEPFVLKRQEFSVIPLATLFKKMGIKSWEVVTTKALNNYVYENTASQFTSAKGYLAIKRNGLDIPYDQGGPIRLIYPDSSKWAKSLDPWNWSLSSISVKK
jgi:hypothetical protein